MRLLIIGLVGALFLTASGYAQLSGTYTIGATGDYPDLTAAMNALNSQGISGNVRFEILPDYAGEPRATTNTINVAQLVPTHAWDNTMLPSPCIVVLQVPLR
jgi:hypothetical protein